MGRSDGMNEHGFPLAFKWRIVVLVDVFLSVISTWWIVHYAYEHDWLNVAYWLVSAAFYYWFGVRQHLRWHREEMTGDGGG